MKVEQIEVSGNPPFAKKDDLWTDNGVLKIYTGSEWVPVTGGGGGLAAVVDDLAPELGGHLDANLRNINDVMEMNANGVNAHQVQIVPGFGEVGLIRMYDGSGLASATLRAPETVSSSYGLRLPTSQGAVNQLLGTDGSGQLEWADPPYGSELLEVNMDSLISSSGLRFHVARHGDSVTLTAFEFAGEALIDTAGALRALNAVPSEYRPRYTCRCVIPLKINNVITLTVVEVTWSGTIFLYKTPGGDNFASGDLVELPSAVSITYYSPAP